MEKRVSATIWLPYFKQGDDLHSSIIMNDGHVDAKATLLNHIGRLEMAIEMLQKIHDLIPTDNTVNLYGDCHFIQITGNQSLIEMLEKNHLAQVEEYDEEYDEEYSDYEDEEDTDEMKDHEEETRDKNEKKITKMIKLY